MSTVESIAFVCPRFAEGATVGGAETLLRRLAERTAASGRGVTFLTTCAENHFTWENAIPAGSRTVGQIEVIRFPVNEDRDVESFLRIQNSISHDGNVDKRDEEKWIANSVNSTELYDHLRNHGNEYDCLIMGPYLFGITCFAARIHPEKTLLVPCLHDEPFAYLKIMQELFHNVAGFLFNSEPERELARRIFDLPKDKCAVVGMGLDPFEADPGVFAARHNLQQPYILYSGRREPLKGTPLLLDYVHAFRERTGADIKLVMTGSGPINPSAEMEPHLLDVGMVSEKEKQEAMAGGAVFCHPSTNESFGIVLLESWLAGTPGLVHAGSDVLRYQCRRSGGGLWFRSYLEFEEELLLLLRDKELREKMGHCGQQYVLREYSWAKVEDRLFDALARLV